MRLRSFRLFSKRFLLAYAIEYLSVLQRLHPFFSLFVDLISLIIDHLIVGVFPSFINFQQWFDSSVVFRLVSQDKDVLWFLYRSLKLFPVVPMYILLSSSLPSFVVISALQTKFFRKHSPLIGQSSGLRQLHNFSAASGLDPMFLLHDVISFFYII